MLLNMFKGLQRLPHFQKCLLVFNSMRHGASGMWQSTSRNINFVPSNVYCKKKTGKILFHNSHLCGFLSWIKKTESNI